jgi:hypothetical protein
MLKNLEERLIAGPLCRSWSRQKRLMAGTAAECVEKLARIAVASRATRVEENCTAPLGRLGSAHTQHGH